jgi:hypothetical protein
MISIGSTLTFRKAACFAKRHTARLCRYFDNSEKNKYNPDPSKAVRWGDQTWEEMMIGWYTYTRADTPAKPARQHHQRGNNLLLASALHFSWLHSQLTGFPEGLQSYVDS